MPSHTLRLVSQADLERIEPPAGNGRWFPRGHHEILKLVTAAMETADLHIRNMQLVTMRDAGRLVGFLETDTEVAAERKLVVGVCNSHDKSYSQRLFYGLRKADDLELLLCSKPVRRKHTKNSIGRFEEIVEGLSMSARQYVEDTRLLVQQLLQTPMPDQEAESLLLRLFERSVLPHPALPDAIKGWRQVPRGDDQTAFALLLAVDGSTKERAFRDPKKYVDRSGSLRAFFEEIIREEG